MGSGANRLGRESAPVWDAGTTDKDLASRAMVLVPVPAFLEPVPLLHSPTFVPALLTRFRHDCHPVGSSSALTAELCPGSRRDHGRPVVAQVCCSSTVGSECCQHLGWYRCHGTSWLLHFPSSTLLKVWESSRRWPKDLGPCTHMTELEETGC